MNIDTLRNSDNTYRAADYIDVVRCLKAGHVTHLQRDDRVMAFRPGKDIDGDDAFLVTRQYKAQRQADRWFKADDLNRIVRIALVFLNGEANSYEANDSVDVFANQADRDGYVLAINGDFILIEYFMPNGSTALREQRVLGRRYVGNYKAISYNSVPKRWINAMREQGVSDWEGRGQRAHQPIPFPAA